MPILFQNDAHVSVLTTVHCKTASVDSNIDLRDRKPRTTKTESKSSFVSKYAAVWQIPQHSRTKKHLGSP